MKQTIEEKDISDNNLVVGRVIYAFGPLVHVLVNDKVIKGAIAYVVLSDGVKLMSEVIEINGSTVKIQVFEDTRGVSVGLEVLFLESLLSAVLAPGLLGHVFDGLQNPLSDLAKISGIKLTRGLYVDPVNQSKLWDYTPLRKDGDICYSGDKLGFVIENDLKHYIMAPLDLNGPWRISHTHPASSVCVKDVIAVLISSDDPVGEERLVRLCLSHPIKTPFIHGTKIASFEPLITGLRVLDMQMPLMKGGSFASPGPFGAGKTMLQYHLARFSNVDVVVLVACGERAGEVVQFISEFKEIKDPRTGKSLMERTIIICNTSSMPVAARESSLYLGVTIGEYYRQMGYDVLVLADSTSRWAQAMREISGKLEEIPGEEAYPPYLASSISAFYERAGVLDTGSSLGSLTIGGAVSPAGGNFEEPVTQATLASVGAFIGLSKSRADARKFPAIDPLISWSNNVKKTADYWKETADSFMSAWNNTKQLLIKGYDIARLIEVLGEDGVSLHDLTKFLQAEIYDFVFLQQNAFDEDDRYSSSEKSQALLTVILTVCSADVFGNSPDEARDIASKVKFLMKNLCYMNVKSLEFQNSVAEVYKLINTNTNHIEVV